MLHTAGDGTTFSSFTPVGDGYTYSPSVWAGADASTFTLIETKPVEAGLPTGAISVSMNGRNATYADWPPATYGLVSGSEFIAFAGSGYGTREVVAYDAQGYLERMVCYSASSNGCYSPELFDPPGGNAFQHSPSICDIHRNGNSEQAFMVATAGDRIWYTS